MDCPMCNRVNVALIQLGDDADSDRVCWSCWMHSRSLK